MIPVVAFINNKAGVGTTTLAYHTAWMLRRLGVNVLAVDLDPQANLTSAFVDDEVIESLWRDDQRSTVYGAIAPLFEGEGGLADPYVHEIEPGLWLVPGDLVLSGTEQELSTAWPNAGDGNKRAFRVLASFATIAQRAAEMCQADLVLLDVGPNLGAINRAAMVASDHVVVPLSPDLYSLQGLRNLGPMLRTWRREWDDRRSRAGNLWIPEGGMHPAGYVVLQHGVRLDRVVGAYDRWLRRVPAEYRTAVLDDLKNEADAPLAADDPHCLGLMKHYHSLVPMAQEARRPIFLLRSADGAIGAHQQAVQASYHHFADLARRILDAIGAGALVP